MEETKLKSCILLEYSINRCERIESSNKSVLHITMYDESGLETTAAVLIQ